jgi:drug/metabolite transporter (DMT)-like permease
MDRKKIFTLLAFLCVYIVWGSTFMATRLGLESFSPFIMSGFRFLIAGLLLLAWLVFKSEPLPSWRTIRINAVSGILILGISTGMLVWSQQYLDTKEAATLVAVEPFIFLLMDRSKWRYYFTNKTIIAGLIAGFSGLTLFLSSETGSTTVSPMRDIAIVVLLSGAIFWVLGALYARNNNSSDSSVKMNVAIQLISAGLFSLITATVRDEWSMFDPNNIKLISLISLFYLIIFGSLITYLCYVWLIANIPPAIVSTHTFVNPVIAVILGSIFLHESVSALQVLALFIILFGVMLTNLSNYNLPMKWKFKLRNTQ